MATNRRTVRQQATRFRTPSQFLVHALHSPHPTLYSVCLFRLLHAGLIDTLATIEFDGPYSLLYPELERYFKISNCPERKY